MDNIFLDVKQPTTIGDTDYLICMDDIFHTHKWLECEVCGDMKVIKKGYSFVGCMKRLGWIYKPCVEKSRKKWQQKMWICPDCQKITTLNDYLTKFNRLCDITRLEEARQLTDKECRERTELRRWLAQYGGIAELNYHLYKMKHGIE